MADPVPGSVFSCPRTTEPDLIDHARRYLKLGPTDPIPRCWAWSCPGCSHLKQWGSKRYIMLGALEAAARGDCVAFVTLTEPGLARSWDESSKALTRLLNVENQRLKDRGLRPLRYCAVPELQQRGAVHWHGLVAVDPNVIDATCFGSQRDLRAAAVRYGFGHQDDLAHLGQARELVRAAGYCGKYLVKDQRVVTSVTDSQRFRRVRSSTGQRRWCSWGTATDCVHSYSQARAHGLELRTGLGL